MTAADRSTSAATPASPIAPVTVASLLCHKYVPMALKCLATFRVATSTPIEFVLHDDGSLTDQDAHELALALAPCRVVRRPEADALMAERLRHYPHCAAFRNETCMALKLCDSIQLCTRDIYCYVDADVLFLRRATNLLDFPTPDTELLFMYDPQNYYSIRSWNLIRSPGVKLPAHFNAGFCLVRTRAYDPDFIEWFLSKPRHATNRHNGLPEQTAWAALSSRLKSMSWHQDYVRVMNHQFLDTLCVGHFVGGIRDQLDRYHQIATTRTLAQAPLAIPHADLGRCSAAKLFSEEINRIVGRYRDRRRARRAAASQIPS